MNRQGRTSVFRRLTVLFFLLEAIILVGVSVLLFRYARIQEEAKQRTRGETVRRSLAQIEKDISVTALADHYHFSREYIMRVFKKEEGVTILQHVNDAKIQRTKELLADPERSVRSIAEMTGFSGTG